MNSTVDTTELFRKAFQYHQDKDYNNALNSYQSVLQQNPKHADALHLVGMIYAQSNNLNLAHEFMGKAINIQPENPLFHNNLGNVYKAQKKWDKAFSQYHKALTHDPNYAEAHNNLASLYHLQNNYEKALEHYAKAVHIKPHYVEAHQNLGLLLLRQEDQEAAIKQFNNVLSLKPHALNAHFHLGNIYLNQDRLAQAKQHYQAVIELNPEHIETLNNLGVIALKQQQSQVALDYFSNALALDNDHSGARSNIAATFMLHNQYENALRHYRELVKQQAHDVEVHYNMGVALMALGKLKEATTCYQKAIALEPRHAAAQANFAAILLRLGKRQEAISAYQKALALDPQNEVVKFLLSAVKGEQESSAPPLNYVKNLFDNYAVQYEQHLQKVLKYNLPQELLTLFQAQHHDNKPLAILDIGCGTGLVAKQFHDLASYLAGVDLSSSMIEIARAKNLYDELWVGDFHEYRNLSDQGYDLIVAAEVFSYIGDLSATFIHCAKCLSDHGQILFSIEVTGSYPYRLQETARYAHAPLYIEELAKNQGFKIIQSKQISARLQDNCALTEIIYLLERV